MVLAVCGLLSMVRFDKDLPLRRNHVDSLYFCSDSVGYSASLLTPRTRENGIAYGGFILTASHNPGGLNADFGVKFVSSSSSHSRFNGENGAAAAEHITNGIYTESLKISELKMAELPEVPIDEIATLTYTVADRPFIVEIISSTEDYIRILQSVFDFPRIAALFRRPDFHFHFDAINGVSGAYAGPIFHDLLGAPLDSLHNCVPKPVLSLPRGYA